MSFDIHGSEFGAPRLQTWFVLLLLTVVFAGLTSGCILIPTPHYYDTGSRQNLTAQSTNLIQPGVDTIEDVLLKLGEPDNVSPDERRISYSSKKIIGLMIVIGVDTDGSELPDIPQYHFLDITLDNQGVVTHREFTKVGTYLKQVETFPRERIDRLLTNSIGGEEIIASSRAAWFPCPGSDGSIPESALTTISRGLGHGFGLCGAPGNQPVFGCLMLTGSTLNFMKTTQWLNEPPALSLRYDSLAECGLCESRLHSGSALIVSTKDNHCCIFDFDGISAQSTCDLIQGKIKPTQPGK
jgi:hypothetical protein